MKIPFKKMSGAGNDFIVVDNRDGTLGDAIERIVPGVCDRTTPWGGADGFIAIVNSPNTEFEMLYFNADGSTGAMCGNGGRCAARFALTQHIVKHGHMTFDVVGNNYEADVHGNRVRLMMPPPKEIRLSHKIDVMNQRITYHYVDVETPHAIIFMEDIIDPKLDTLGDLDIDSWGPAVRNHPLFHPGGANANFARVKKDGTVGLRTYERGVEGETLACGTGSVATALVAHLVYNISPPVRIATASGETLVVDFTQDGKVISNLSLEGSALTDAEGEFEV